MKIKILFSFASLFVFTCSFLLGQESYMVGDSKLSIEPEPQLLSIALAGYGAPRDGRFSLKWERINESFAFQILGMGDGDVFALGQNGEIFKKSLFAKKEWKKVGGFPKAKIITSNKKHVYLVDSLGQVFSQEKTTNIDFKWAKIDEFDIDEFDEIKDAKITGDSLLILGSDNVLYFNLVNEKEKLVKISSIKAPNLISFDIYQDRIYGLDEEKRLWYRSLNHHSSVEWIQIGRKNGFTYNINPEKIYVSNNKFFALDDNKTLYEATHSTKDDLSVRSLVIKDEKSTVLLITLDLTGFNISFTNEIKKEVLKKWGIPYEAVMINASHTHFAPVTQSWRTWAEFYQNPDSLYLNDFLKKRILASVDSAIVNLEKSQLQFYRGTTEIGENRRLNVRAEAISDNTLDVIQIKSLKRLKQSLLFSTSCHAVFNNSGSESFTLNANFPGVARRILENELNNNNSFFLNGCSGDINPKKPSHEITGIELAYDISNIISGKGEKITGEISFFLDTIKIPFSTMSKSKIQEFKMKNEPLKGDVTAEKNVRWADLMLEKYDNNELEENMMIFVQTLNVGDWKIVGLSREAVNEYGIEIRNLWPGDKVTVSAYNNDVSSYLPVDWHVKYKTYEGYDSFFWYGQESAPPLDIKSRVIKEIKRKNR